MIRKLTEEEKADRAQKRADSARDRGMGRALEILKPYFAGVIIVGCTYEDAQGKGGVIARIGKGHNNMIYGLLKRAVNDIENWDKLILERDLERQITNGRKRND